MGCSENSNSSQNASSQDIENSRVLFGHLRSLGYSLYEDNDLLSSITSNSKQLSKGIEDSFLDPMSTFIKNDFEHLSSALSYFYNNSSQISYTSGQYTVNLESNVSLNTGAFGTIVVPKFLTFTNNSYEGNVSVNSISISTFDAKYSFNLEIKAKSLTSNEKYDFQVFADKNTTSYFVCDANVSLSNDTIDANLTNVEFLTFGVLEAIDANFTNPNYDDVYININSGEIDLKNDDIHIEGNVSVSYENNKTISNIEFNGSINSKNILLKQSLVDKSKTYTSSNIMYNLIFSQELYKIDAGYKFFENNKSFSINISTDDYVLDGNMSLIEDKNVSLSLTDNNNITFDANYNSGTLDGNTSNNNSIIGIVDNKRGFPTITYEYNGYKYFESIF